MYYELRTFIPKDIGLGPRLQGRSRASRKDAWSSWADVPVVQEGEDTEQRELSLYRFILGQDVGLRRDAYVAAERQEDAYQAALKAYPGQRLSGPILLQRVIVAD